MKKVLSLLLIGTMLLSVIGCSNQEKDLEGQTMPELNEPTMSYEQLVKAKPEDIQKEINNIAGKEIIPKFKLDKEQSIKEMGVFTYVTQLDENTTIELYYENSKLTDMLISNKYGTLSDEISTQIDNNLARYALIKLNFPSKSISELSELSDSLSCKKQLSGDMTSESTVDNINCSVTAASGDGVTYILKFSYIQ